VAREYRYRTTHPHAMTEHAIDSFAAALDALRSVYGDDIFWDGSPDELESSVLVWREAVERD